MPSGHWKRERLMARSLPVSDSDHGGDFCGFREQG